MAGTCHVTAYLVACFHPPFPVLVFVYVLVGLGSGAKTAAWNSFVGGFKNSNELLGLLHGFYGLGATITPVTASALFSHYGWRWYQVYYVLVAMAASEFVLTLSLFYPQNGRAYREEIGESQVQQDQLVRMRACHPSGETHLQESLAARSFSTRNTWNCLRNKVVLVCSAFLLAYVGSEVALGGWLVTFMIDVRGGSAFASGLTASGFWAGITVGRIILGFVTGRVFKSEKHAATVYLFCAIIMQVLYWLIPNFIASAIIVAFLGMMVLSPRFESFSDDISQVSALALCSPWLLSACHVSCHRGCGCRPSEFAQPSGRPVHRLFHSWSELLPKPKAQLCYSPSYSRSLQSAFCCGYYSQDFHYERAPSHDKRQKPQSNTM